MHAVVPGRWHAGGLEGGLPRVGVEVVAVDGLALPAREHETVAFGRPPAEVLGQLGADGVRQRHGAGLAALGRCEQHVSAEELDLLLDVQLAPKEVDVADPQPEHHTPPEPAAGRDDADRPVPVRSAANTASTCSMVQGSILRWSRFGSFTEPARQGFVVMSPSSTAALKTLETLVNTVRT